MTAETKIFAAGTTHIAGHSVHPNADVNQKVLEHVTGHNADFDALHHIKSIAADMGYPQYAVYTEKALNEMSGQLSSPTFSKKPLDKDGTSLTTA